MKIRETCLAPLRTPIEFKVDKGAKQGHHHGSIDDPELLARYQAAVKGAK